MNIEVTAVQHDSDDCVDNDGSPAVKGWMLTFKFSALDSSWCFEFDAIEPGMWPLSRWMALAAGDENVYMRLYQGNGEGCIQVEDAAQGKDAAQVKTLVFMAAPSGAGGDVSSVFRVPFEFVAPHLRAALADAERSGYRFEKEGGLAKREVRTATS